jgi:hypothetical protein
MHASKKFVQCCWVVQDIHSAVRHWLETAGVGPFYVSPKLTCPDFRYRGQPQTLMLTGAFAQAGSVQIELVQQHNDAPSAYSELQAMGPAGFHHLARFSDDYEAELESCRRNDQRPAMEGLYGDVRFFYVDARSTVGCFLEILERKRSIIDMFDMIARAGEGWDGKDPIRPL